MRLLKPMLAALLLTAAPGFAQSTTAVAPAQQGVPGMGPGMGKHMFGTMSPEGRRIMMDTMRSMDPGHDGPRGRGRGGSDAVRAARDEMLTLLGADRLDVPALKRSMDAEREAANSAKMRHQVAMLAAFQKLTLADRRAFVADARSMRDRMEKRVGKHGDIRRPGRDMSPPPPM